MNSPILADAWWAQAFQEDIGDGDKTTLATIASDAQGQAYFLAKQKLTLCGTDLADQAFAYIGHPASIDWTAQDGDILDQGQVFGTLSGPVATMLQGERTVLNLLQRLSGIATQTRLYTQLTQGSSTVILDTRKTLPLYRSLEKYAVACGGATNHRFGLYDQMMIKDNHIQANQGDVARTVAKAKAQYPDVFLVVEIAHPDQIEPAIEQGADRLLLDNMDNDQIKHCQSLIQKRVPIEVSGGVTLERIPSLVALEVDAISVGAITHSATAVDISMKIN
jgi:nicotinate-nucleotide pyrophosphorylase (carboxylating)